MMADDANIIRNYFASEAMRKIFKKALERHSRVIENLYDEVKKLIASDQFHYGTTKTDSITKKDFEAFSMICLELERI